MKYFLVVLATGLVMILAVLSWHYKQKYDNARDEFVDMIDSMPDTIIVRDTIYDTIKIAYPKPKIRLIIDTLYLPCPDDSISLEIEQKHYHHKDWYDAYVSGYKPRLDSIRIYTTRFFDTIRVPVPVIVPYERRGLWIQSNKHKDKYYGIGSIKR